MAVGWHTLRHSYATQSNAKDEGVQGMQAALRLVNSRITLAAYTQAVTPAKNQAQIRIVSMILPKRIQTAEAGGGK